MPTLNVQFLWRNVLSSDDTLWGRKSTPWRSPERHSNTPANSQTHSVVHDPFDQSPPIDQSDPRNTSLAAKAWRAITSGPRDVFFFFFWNKLRDTSLSCGTINYSQPSRMRPGWDGLTRLTLLCIPLTVTHLNLGDRQASAQRRDSTRKTTSQYQRPSTVAGKQNLPWGQRVPSEESRLT